LPPLDFVRALTALRAHVLVALVDEVGLDGQSLSQEPSTCGI
jgi:hypothetical protein